MASHDAQPETAPSSESLSRPEASTARQNTRNEATRAPNQAAKQKVDFSIDGLLSDRTSTTQSSFKVDLEFSPGAEECSEKASTDDRSSRFDWLQCSRYKPPKLPRKLPGEILLFVAILLDKVTITTISFINIK